MEYLVTKESYKGLVRWSVGRSVNDKLEALGHYPTRKAAVTVARLLAGWSGTVSVIKGSRS